MHDAEITSRGHSWTGRVTRWLFVGRAHTELNGLLLLLLVAAGIWGFVEIADLVADGSTGDLDHALLIALRSSADLANPIGPKWAEEMARDFTSLGGMPILAFLTLTVSGFLALRGSRSAACYVLLAAFLGMLMSAGLKELFDRPRPDVVPHLMHVSSASFPSGHSMMAAVVYLTLGALLARHQDQVRLKIFLLAIAVLITVVVGASRVYVGVHWPTDVVAGWTAGATWALLCTYLARFLERREAIEGEPE